jgi:hypothetical protein
MPDDAIVEADGLEAEYAEYFEYNERERNLRGAPGVVVISP